MDFTATTGWWVAAGAAVALELATGTFYLLMIALGLAAAALAAQFGLASVAQILTAALVGSGATAAWHLLRARQPPAAPARLNRDVNLDIGDRVQVDGWLNDDSARVQHRGTTWTARREPGAAARTGPHVVVGVEGNWLVVAPLAATSDADSTHPHAFDRSNASLAKDRSD